MAWTVCISTGRRQIRPATLSPEPVVNLDSGRTDSSMYFQRRPPRKSEPVLAGRKGTISSLLVGYRNSAIRYEPCNRVTVAVGGAEDQSARTLGSLRGRRIGCCSASIPIILLWAPFGVGDQADGKLRLGSNMTVRQTTRVFTVIIPAPMILAGRQPFAAQELAQHRNPGASIAGPTIRWLALGTDK